MKRLIIEIDLPRDTRDLATDSRAQRAAVAAVEELFRRTSYGVGSFAEGVVFRNEREAKTGEAIAEWRVTQ